MTAESGQTEELHIEGADAAPLHAHARRARTWLRRRWRRRWNAPTRASCTCLSSSRSWSLPASPHLLGAPTSFPSRCSASASARCSCLRVTLRAEERLAAEVDASDRTQPRRVRNALRPHVGAAGERGALPRPDRRAGRPCRAPRPRRPHRLHQPGLRRAHRRRATASLPAARWPSSASMSASCRTPPSPTANA